MNIVQSIFTQVCLPDPRFFPSELKRKHQFERNRAFLVMLITLLIFLILYICWRSENATLGPPACIFIILITIIIFILTRNLDPFIFKVFFALMITCVGPLCFSLDTEGVFGGWITVHIVPVLLLFFSDSYLLYVVQVGIQIFLLNFYYREGMIKNIESKLSHDYVRKLTSATMLIMMTNAVMVYKMHTLLENPYKQEIMLQEAKTKELEVQKSFILSFSHEIRNLINTLIGNVQLSLLEKVTPKVKNCLEDAEVGASLLLQLINNILDTGNLEIGELEMNPSTKTIHNTLEKIWTMCAYLLKAKNLKGQLTISRNLPKDLKLDHSRLMQILINLITNAVKFTHKGSVDIKIEWVKEHKSVNDECFLPEPFDDENEGLFEKDLALSVLHNDFTFLGTEKKRWSPDRYNTTQGSGPGILKISVTDTGSGVLSKNLAHVFDRFSDQVFGDNSAKRLGTTIGLYVTKELCNRMGGDIRVFSKVNVGTTFIVCLPAEQVAIENACEPEFKGLMFADERKLRAMIVDDLNFNIVVLSNYLERMDISIAHTAINGQEAYEKYVQSVIEGHQLDIVTMDVEMPVMDGKEAAKKIREFEQKNNLRPCLLIMISGNVCESEISQCLRHNGKELANHFLKKPATFDDIYRLISKDVNSPSLKKPRVWA